MWETVPHLFTPPTGGSTKAISRHFRPDHSADTRHLDEERRRGVCSPSLSSPSFQHEIAQRQQMLWAGTWYLPCTPVQSLTLRTMQKLYHICACHILPQFDGVLVRDKHRYSLRRISCYNGLLVFRHCHCHDARSLSHCDSLLLSCSLFFPRSCPRRITLSRRRRPPQQIHRKKKKKKNILLV